jgi:hypothetical protein
MTYWVHFFLNILKGMNPETFFSSDDSPYPPNPPLHDQFQNHKTLNRSLGKTALILQYFMSVRRGSQAATLQPDIHHQKIYRFQIFSI